jgi:hypothetical protein
VSIRKAVTTLLGFLLFSLILGVYRLLSIFVGKGVRAVILILLSLGFGVLGLWVRQAAGEMQATDERRKTATCTVVDSRIDEESDWEIAVQLQVRWSVAGEPYLTKKIESSESPFLTLPSIEYDVATVESAYVIGSSFECFYESAEPSRVYPSSEPWVRLYREGAGVFLMAAFAVFVYALFVLMASARGRRTIWPAGTWRRLTILLVTVVSVVFAQFAGEAEAPLIYWLLCIGFGAVAFGLYWTEPWASGLNDDEDNEADEDESHPGTERSVERKVLRSTKRASRGWLELGFGLVLAPLMVAVLAYLAHEIYRQIDSYSWHDAECAIGKAWVDTSTDDEGETYSVAVQYTYVYKGEKYTGDQYQISQTWTSYIDDMTATVNALLKAKTVACYVNPANPADSVIDRHIGLVLFYFWFACLGLFAAGIFLVRDGVKRLKLARRFHQRRVECTARCSAGRIELDARCAMPSSERAQKKNGKLEKTESYALLFALWFTSAAVILYPTIWALASAWGQISFLWTGLTLSAAILAGLFCLVASLGALSLAIFSGPKMTLRSNALHLGCEVELLWRASSPFSVHVEAREWVEFTDDDETDTEEHVARVVKVGEVGDVTKRNAQPLFIRLPTDAVPTFYSQHNRVQWFLCVKEGVDDASAVPNEYELVVYPAPGWGTS